MQLLALGGASAIGASATLLTIAGRKILVDAGVRPGTGGEGALPDLARLEKEGIDGCVLTHAHADHWGALPRILQARKVPVLTTRPTRDLVLQQIHGALGRRKGGETLEKELPALRVKDGDLIDRSLSTGEFLQPLRPFGSEVRVTLFPAGHILGAASVLFESSEGRLWCSGDFTFRDSATVPGVLLPLGRVDIVVVDSTLGGEGSVSRTEEENNLTEALTEALQREGKLLFPMFAVGRAQEILVLLKRAARRGTLPLPIYVDGGVADVCDLYSEYPMFLRSELRRELRAGKLISTERIQRVRDAAHRKEILDGPPCALISTGGLLNGGPAAEAAAALVGGEENTIFLVADPDEEHPGSALLKKASAKSPQLLINGKAVPAKASLVDFTLAMHADAKEVQQTVSRMTPRRSVLLHGSSAARTALASSLLRFTHTETDLALEGEPVDLPTPRQRSVFEAPRRSREVRQPEPTLLRVLAAQLAQGQRRIFSLDELILLYTEQEGVTDDEFRGRFGRAIDKATTFPRFVPDERRPYLYRVITNEDTRWSPEELRSYVHSVFRDEGDYYRVGFYDLERRLKLYFDFPELADVRHRDRIRQIAEETGWTVEVNEIPRTERFVEIAREIVPPDVYLPSRPRIQTRDRSVTIRVREFPDDEPLADWSRKFKEQTGYALDVLRGSEEDVDVEVPRLEVNQAFERILERFESEPDKPYRKSRKSDDYGEYIELAFLTPEIGRRYLDPLSELAAETGWRIDIAPGANLSGLQDTVRSMLPEGATLAREPSYFPKTRHVRIKLAVALPEPETEALKVKFKERTGVPLEIE